MHYIQKHILDILRTVSTMRYAELNQDEIESGHFRYHLTQLIKDGSVEQVQRGQYRLTPAGKRLVDRLSEHRVNARVMPKVITYTLLTDGANVLVQEKPKEPYRGLLNMIGGKLHQGETSVEAAVREVKEKTGVDIGRPSLRGIFEIIIRDGDELFTHVIAYVHHLEVSSSHFANTSVMALRKDGLPALPNLAPDFMPIYERISKRANDGTCAETLLLNLR